MVHDEVLKQIDSDDLSVLAVWMPVLQSDNAAAGKKAEPLLPDPRVAHYWDDDKSLGKLYGRSLELPRGRRHQVGVQQERRWRPADGPALSDVTRVHPRRPCGARPCA